MQQFRAVCETLIGDGLEGAGGLADSAEVFGYSSLRVPAPAPPGSKTQVVAEAGGFLIPQVMSLLVCQSSTNIQG